MILELGQRDGLQPPAGAVPPAGVPARQAEVGDGVVAVALPPVLQQGGRQGVQGALPHTQAQHVTIVMLLNPHPDPELPILDNVQNVRSLNSVGYYRY